MVFPEPGHRGGDDAERDEGPQVAAQDRRHQQAHVVGLVGLAHPREVPQEGGEQELAGGPYLLAGRLPGHRLERAPCWPGTGRLPGHSRAAAAGCRRAAAPARRRCRTAAAAPATPSGRAPPSRTAVGGVTSSSIGLGAAVCRLAAPRPVGVGVLGEQRGQLRAPGPRWPSPAAVSPRHPRPPPRCRTPSRRHHAPAADVGAGYLPGVDRLPQRPDGGRAAGRLDVRLDPPVASARRLASARLGTRLTGRLPASPRRTSAAPRAPRRAGPASSAAATRVSSASSRVDLPGRDHFRCPAARPVQRVVAVAALTGTGPCRGVLASAARRTRPGVPASGGYCSRARARSGRSMQAAVPYRRHRQFIRACRPLATRPPRRSRRRPLSRPPAGRAARPICGSRRPPAR